ncbi:MAG: hypothetical protein KAU62_12510 [Candidatus Heimdallarchaeota archaeon]|nr:hypothetical protein [Candidatus Heimdallarchaeota archaeon]MCK4611972.1 hypothetical protein [Candidatus Heimdallarchaeota archaeon]
MSKIYLTEEVKDWLLQGSSWLQYRTRIDLLNQKKDNEIVLEVQHSMMNDSLFQNLINEFQMWPGEALKRHNDAKHLIHKLVFTADLGLTRKDKVIENVAKKILSQQSEEGQFQTLLNVNERYGGSGKDELNWMLCDSPLLLYFLAKVGYANHKQIDEAAAHLASFVRDNGWPCGSSSSYKGFRGPGRKDDPCPYANLVSLRALAQIDKWKDHKVVRQGTDTLLHLWENRKSKKAYLFGMGTDFKKLKAPLIWYDILHVTDVLSQFSWVQKDERFLEMINILKMKFDEKGKCTAESVWRAWKDWDFGQKREPSKWITMLVYRIFNRIE